MKYNIIRMKKAAVLFTCALILTPVMAQRCITPDSWWPGLPEENCFEEAKNIIYDIIWTYDDLKSRNMTVLITDLENLICDSLIYFKDCYETIA